MKTKAVALVSTGLFLIVLVCSGASQETREPSAQKEVPSSLVRKDLLKPTRKPLSPPLRNIFTRQRVSSSGERGGILGAERQLASGGRTGRAGSNKGNKEFSINVKYIGYVNSEERVIALIILGGEAYAVASGDLLEGGIHVGEITPEDIEVIGPDSESNKVKLEGEEP